MTTILPELARYLRRSGLHHDTIVVTYSFAADYIKVSDSAEPLLAPVYYDTEMWEAAHPLRVLSATLCICLFDRIHNKPDQ